MNRLRALDSAIIEFVQEAYLWLWDRTGVYVATLIYACIVSDHVCSGPLRPLDFGLLAIMGVWSGIRYVAQEKDLRWLNILQLAWSNFVVRLPVCLVFILCAFDVCQFKLWTATGDAFFLIWNYLACIQVHDRAPKDFLAFRKPAGAGA